MTITLLGRAYRVALDLTGRTVVLVQCGKYLWRVASARDSEWVLAGLRTEVVQ